MNNTEIMQYVYQFDCGSVDSKKAQEIGIIKLVNVAIKNHKNGERLKEKELVSIWFVLRSNYRILKTGKILDSTKTQLSYLASLPFQFFNKGDEFVKGGLNSIQRQNILELKNKIEDILSYEYSKTIKQLISKNKRNQTEKEDEDEDEDE